jgi:DNA helicase-2/ATP-dependent DNA helicase PcrA
LIYFLSIILVDCRARLNARVDPGALSAGQAWILGYRADDSFGGICERGINLKIMEDIEIWRKHWDYYLKSQPGGKHDLSFFLSHVALGTTQQPRQEGLALLTIHSAKGLEFDIVVIMGMVEEVFPDYRARNDALTEERRNAFVAVTRSKRLLVFSYPKEKMMPWGSSRKQRPSRYLADLGLI